MAAIELNIKHLPKFKKLFESECIRPKEFNNNGTKTIGLELVSDSITILILRPIPKRTKNREFELTYINSFGQLIIELLTAKESFNKVDRKLSLILGSILPDTITR